MSALADFHFLRPAWFAALVPLALVLALLARGGGLKSGWEAVCDRHLLPFVLLGRSRARRRSSLALVALAGVVAITALAGPTWERAPQPVFRDRSALVMALDLSRSMDATDVAPSRLARARFKIRDILARRKSGQTALVVYAAQAFVVVPLTDDNNALTLYLQSLTTDLLPAQGSRPDRALQEAGALLLQAGVQRGDVLLVGDYADARADAEARHLVAKGYRVSVLGVGTDNGAPVPLASGDFVSAGGDTVISTLAKDELKAVADAGDGIYRRLTLAGDDDSADLAAWLQSAPQPRAEQDETEETAVTDVWRERGPWLLLLLVPLAAAFRRGVLVAAAVALLPLPPSAEALDWGGLWLRPDQRAARALEQGDAETAARLFEDARWKAAAQYRNEDYTDAVQTLEPFDAADDVYNRGNALARSGALQEAVAAYKRALELRPDMDDAQHNLRLVEQLMQQQQQRQQQRGDGERRQGEEQPQQARQQSGEQQQQGAQPPPQAAPEQSQAADAADAEGDEADAANAANATPQVVGEDEQAVEQHLRRISDDPRRLLQRKLRYLHRLKQREAGDPPGDSPW